MTGALTRCAPARALASAAALAALLVGVAAAAQPGEAYRLVERWPLQVPGGWDYLTFDASRHRLFVTRSDRIQVLDTSTGAIAATIPGTEGAHGVALADDLGRGYISNGRSDSVTVFDLEKLTTVQTVPAGGHNPDAIVYDPSTRRVLAFNGRSRNATVFDAQTLAQLASLPLPGKPEFAVVDGAGRVYVNIETEQGQMVVIDARRAAVVQTWALRDCSEPTGLAIDRLRHRLFSTCSNRTMAVTDADDGHAVARLPIGAGPDAAAVEEATHTVYSANGEGNVSLIRETALDVYQADAPLATEPGARTLALDSALQRVYLITAKFMPGVPTPDNPHPKPRPVDGTAAVLVLQRGGAAPALAR